MYINLKIRLMLKKMTLADLARQTGINYQTLRSRTKGESDFTLEECKLIRNALDWHDDLETLFEKVEGTA